MKELIIISLVFTMGLVIGEYKACPKDKYTFDYGCRK